MGMEELRRSQDARELEIRRNEDLVDEMRRLKYDVEKMLEKQQDTASDKSSSVKNQQFNQRVLNSQYNSYDNPNFRNPYGSGQLIQTPAMPILLQPVTPHSPSVA